ncbi:DUF997 family protein [Oscillibacter hominis]|uniref:DUF997 family protein n=1 Tax=Oscillibacter hominis TaxID=2763056 RepID=A0A7G9B756_9FIRM|nr:DUF997 family protein [Oscillibacter hominis]QNL45387.1 DUF997 family protein [Oscillibacter hominis]
MEKENKNKQKPGFYALCFKEFKFCAIAASVYILLSCLICWILGYSQGGEVAFIAGFPAWAVFGVFIPWILMVILTAIYGFKVMKGDVE